MANDTHKAQTAQPRRFDAGLLPCPKAFYVVEFDTLHEFSDGTATASRCPFCGSTKQPFELNLIAGAHKCESCKVSGGSILEYIEQAKGINREAAITYLGAWTMDSAE